MFFSNKPDQLIFELTNRCNLKCIMCSIWKENPKKDFDLKLFKNILSNKNLREVRCISFTGGEPFMIDNIVDYYLATKKYLPQSFINISTNGYFCKRIIKFLKIVDIKKISITISYDGIYSHDQIRGIKGSADKLMHTLKIVKKKFPTLDVTLKFTIIPQNYREVFNTAVRVDCLGLPFHIKLMEELKCHQNRQQSLEEGYALNKRHMDLIINQTKKMLDLNIKTNRRYIKSLIKKNLKDCVVCNWSTKTWFIGLDGNTFLCRKKKNLGNINNENITEILTSERMNIIKRQMKHCNDINCISYSYS